MSSIVIDTRMLPTPCKLAIILASEFESEKCLPTHDQCRGECTVFSTARRF